MNDYVTAVNTDHMHGGVGICIRLCNLAHMTCGGAGGGTRLWCGVHIKTSPNENIFRVAGPLWGEFEFLPAMHQPKPLTWYQPLYTRLLSILFSCVSLFLYQSMSLISCTEFLFHAHSTKKSNMINHTHIIYHIYHNAESISMFMTSLGTRRSMVVTSHRDQDMGYWKAPVDKHWLSRDFQSSSDNLR